MHWHSLNSQLEEDEKKMRREHVEPYPVTLYLKTAIDSVNAVNTATRIATRMLH